MTRTAPPPLTRRERDRSRVRERILDVARALFAAEGYEAVTMRRVAEEIEYTPPVIYQHFPDKASLVREICYRDWRTFAASFHKLAAIEDPIDRLMAMGAAYVEFALTHPHHYRLMFMTPKPPGGELDKRSIDPEARGNPELDGYAALRAHVDAAFAAKRFHPRYKDAAMVAHVLWQGLHGIVSMHIVMCEDDWVEYRDPRETAQLHMDAIMRGLTCAD